MVFSVWGRVREGERERYDIDSARLSTLFFAQGRPDNHSVVAPLAVAVEGPYIIK